jgi:hypothetical protein
MSAGTQQSIVAGLKYDLRRMHETWMELVYPRQRDATDTVLGKYQPDSQGGMLLYRLWSAVGVPVVGLIYPFVLLGAMLRFGVRGFDSASTRLGLVGVVLVSLVVWGALAAVGRFGMDLRAGGFVALVAAGAVATVSAALALTFKRVGGRAVTVALAYPFGVTAVFLPPVVAALYSPAVADLVLPGSDNLARWMLDNLAVGGLDEYLVENFDREGFAYVIMWFGIAVPVGWVLGLLVTLADLVRPTEE